MNHTTSLPYVLPTQKQSSTGFFSASSPISTCFSHRPLSHLPHLTGPPVLDAKEEDEPFTIIYTFDASAAPHRTSSSTIALAVVPTIANNAYTGRPNTPPSAHLLLLHLHTSLPPPLHDTIFRSLSKHSREKPSQSQSAPWIQLVY